MSQGSYSQTSYSSKLNNGSNKLDYLSLASLSSLVLCNTLAYYAHSYVTKKIKCCEHGLSAHIHKTGQVHILKIINDCEQFSEYHLCSKWTASQTTKKKVKIKQNFNYKIKDQLLINFWLLYKIVNGTGVKFKVLGAAGDAELLEHLNKQ